METSVEKIRRLRESKKLTQKEIAEMIGISRVAYNQIEKGTTQNISIDIGKKISIALGVSFYYLFDIDSFPSDIDKLRLMYIQLKQNAVISVDMYINNSISLKVLFNEDKDPDFEKYKEILKECKKGIYNNFVSTGVCTIDEIKGILKTVNSSI